DQGASVYSVNWHATGIEKNLEPDVIALKFSELPETLLRKFIPRLDLGDLRAYVKKREALMVARITLANRLNAISRDWNMGQHHKTADVQDGEEYISKSRKEFEGKNDKELEAL